MSVTPINDFRHAIVVYPDRIPRGGIFLLDATLSPSGAQSVTRKSLARLRRRTKHMITVERSHHGEIVLAGFSCEAYRAARAESEACSYAIAIEECLGLSTYLVSMRFPFPDLTRTCLYH